MYGLIHDAIEKLVIAKFGVATWNEIKIKAMLGDNELSETYSDEKTLDIVGAAVGVLGLDVEVIVETLGGFFISYVRKRGYDGLLRSMGRDLFTWLQSVNDLHNHLRTQLDKNLLFPEIYCVRENKSDDNAFITHYRSARGALLAPLVVGIIKKVADVYFSSTVSIDRLATQGEDGSEFTSWRVTITGAIIHPPGYVEEDEEGAGGKAFEEADEMQKLALMVAQTSTGEKKSGKPSGGCPFSGRGGAGAGAGGPAILDDDPLASRRELDTIASAFGLSDRNTDAAIAAAALISQSTPRPDDSAAASQSASTKDQLPELGVDGPQLSAIFPFHFVVDKDFKIVQMGYKLSHCVPAVAIGGRIQDYFGIAYPKSTAWTWDDLYVSQDSSFELEIKTPKGQEKPHGAEIFAYNFAGGMYVLSSFDDTKTEPLRAMRLKPEHFKSANGNAFHALFLVEPNINTISSLVANRLAWADFPRHSSQQRLVILAEQLRSEQTKASKAKTDERDARKKEFVDKVFPLDLLIANDFSVWFYIIQITDIAGVEERVKQYVADHHQLAYAQDHNGRVALDVASKANRAAMQSVLLWHGRYHPEDRAEHVSATCFVFKATDEFEKDEFGNPKRVALKLMRNKDQYLREMKARQCGLEAEYVVDVTRFVPSALDVISGMPDHVEFGSRAGAGAGAGRGEQGGKLTKQQAEKLFCIVMPLAERNLFVALKQEFQLGEQFIDTARGVFVQLVQAVGHMHTKGIVHGDIKPLNIVRSTGKWKFIDLDASCQIGVDAVGHKSSSCYAPPEAIGFDESSGLPFVKRAVKSDVILDASFVRRGTRSNSGARSPSAPRSPTNGSPCISRSSSRNELTSSGKMKSVEDFRQPEETKFGLLAPELQPSQARSPEYEHVLAHPSFDIWSLACVFYQLCNADGRALFQGGNDDNLSPDREEEDNLLVLRDWDDDIKQKKLFRVADPMARNLLSQMLSKDPKQRPSIERILAHPFFTHKKVARMLGDEAFYDVFISYRVTSDRDHAERLYQMLTASGLRVWMDAHSLESGVDWKDGFCSGMVNSRAYVCLISRGAINSRENPMQSFSQLAEGSRVDNLYLEMRFALELQSFGLVEKVFPLLIGDMSPKTGQYVDFLQCDCMPRLPQVAVAAVEADLCRQLDSQALGLPLEPNRTVQSVVNAILGCQGYIFRGDPDTSFGEATGRIVRMLRRGEQKRKTAVRRYSL